MKFKKFIKDNIKRISAVILCMIMIFSCTITAFAFDGEAPSLIITANDLKEYHENTYVYYNATHATYGQSPIYSPFNTKTTNAVFTISNSSDGEGIIYSLNADTYISFSTGYLKQGNLKTTYIIPVVASDSTWKEKMLTVESWLLGCPWVTSDSVSWYDVFYTIMAYTYCDKSTPCFRFKNAIEVWDTLGFPSDFFSDDECRLPVVVYTVDFKKDGSISNITYGGYYENIVNGFSNSALLGENGYFYPTQISMYDKTSSDDAPYSSSKTPLLDEPILQTEVINTNQYISTSTYSLTAMDYFAYEEVDGSGSYITLKSNYYALDMGQSFSVDPYVPSHFLKEEYRSTSAFTVLSRDSTNAKYYNNREIYEEGKSWIFIGKNNTNNAKCYGGYYLEFPDGTNPILYLKLIITSSSTSTFDGLYAQLISKVDYTLYSCNYSNGWYNSKLGTFDAETSSYTAENIDTKFQAVDYYSGTMIVNTTVSKYPSIKVSDSENNRKPSLSNVVYGFNCVSSCYSTLTQGVGFYYYISPENMPNIIENSDSFGSSGSDDIGGDNRPNGSLEWEKFWEMTIDYDNLYPDGFDLNLPDYPEFNFDFTGIEDIFDIPDYILIYIIEVTDWLSESLTIFVNSVGGPVKKVYYMVFLSLEAIPDVFRFVIIFSVAILLFLKVLQASSATAFMFSTSVSNGAKEAKKESNRKMNNNQRQNNKKQSGKKGGD